MCKRGRFGVAPWSSFVLWKVLWACLDSRLFLWSTVHTPPPARVLGVCKCSLRCVSVQTWTMYGAMLHRPLLHIVKQAVLWGPREKASVSRGDGDSQVSKMGSERIIMLDCHLQRNVWSSGSGCRKSNFCGHPWYHCCWVISVKVAVENRAFKRCGKASTSPRNTLQRWTDIVRLEEMLRLGCFIPRGTFLNTCGMPRRDGHWQCCSGRKQTKRSQFSPLRDGGEVAKFLRWNHTCDRHSGCWWHWRGLSWGGVCEESRSWWPGSWSRQGSPGRGSGAEGVLDSRTALHSFRAHTSRVCSCIQRELCFQGAIRALTLTPWAKPRKTLYIVWKCRVGGGCDSVTYKDNFSDMDHFESLYWICDSIASLLCFGILALKHVGS